MNAHDLLAELEATGIQVTREGDDLKVRGEPGVSLAPYVERIREHKPALLAELSREVAVKTTTRNPRLLSDAEVQALGLPTTLAWIRVSQDAVEATAPPRGWDGVLPAGCRYPHLCQTLGPCPHSESCGARVERKGAPE